jgi:hypothetical protein
MYDLEKLMRLREWAQYGGTEKERFDYGCWARQVAGGVSLCFAAKTCADAGARFLWQFNTARDVMDKDGRRVSIMSFAARELGLGEMESTVLFAPDHEDGDNLGCAFAFLDVLIERARASKDSMSNREALDWMKAWFEENQVQEEEEK